MGLIELSVGGGGAVVVTLNPLGKVLDWVSGLVTVTLREPTPALEPMVMLAVS